MAESGPQQRKCPWLGVTSVALVVLGLAASAHAATVTRAPTISGDPSPDSRLTASRGDWTPAGATPSYAWLRCDAGGARCTGIPGACGRRYAVRKADEEHALRVRLTATEPDGAAASADSAPTPPVARRPYSIPSDDETNTCIAVTPTGTGQGTFTSGKQVSAAGEPAADTSLPFIDPFPVIRIAGRFKGKKTTLTKVSVRAPKGARIRVACKARGCPYKRKAVAVRLIHLRSLRRTYRPKAQIEIRVTQPQKIGKYTRIRTRRGKAPLRLDRCLMPGKTKPVRCPTG